jgi:AraC family transcriptional regulator
MLDSAGNRLAREALSKLISVATVMLESDRATAKACLIRAAEILSGRGERSAGLPATAPRGGLAPWQRRSVIEYVATHIASTIRVIDLARVARLSRGHFFRAFQESFGETPLAHVAKQRIQHSQSLMLSSSAPLAQIALECGMCDQAHFTRVFRRVVGVNPGIWRRQYGRGDASADVGARTPTAERNLTYAGCGPRGMQA